MDKTCSLHQRLETYAKTDPSVIYSDLNISPHGLTEEQVSAMGKKFGQNHFSSQKSNTIWYRLQKAFLNPFSGILFMLAIVAFITDIYIPHSHTPEDYLYTTSELAPNPTTFIIISTMLVISGMLRFIQETRAKKASDRLIKIINTSVCVRREGKIINCSSENLVVGDIVLLSAGDRIPADMRLTKTSDLFVSQSVLTGESEVLEKDIYSYADFSNLALTGTAVISGSGEGIVLAVGKDTVYGNFSDKNAAQKSSFEKGANSIAWVMIRFMAVLVPIVFMISGITKGNWLTAFLFSLSLAVGLTPEMLPMVINACLAKGSIAMSKKQTIVKNINAMQSFGSMDVLCVDKTGTLTGDSLLLEYYIDILGNENKNVLDFSYLNSFYHTGVQNHLDDAILKCLEMPGQEQHFSALTHENHKLDEIPFDYDRQYVSVLVSQQTGDNQLVVKGNINTVFSRCRYIEYQGSIEIIDETGLASVHAIVDEMLEDGMKVIAVARKPMGNAKYIGISDECDLILMGYLVFFDAPKKTAASAIEKLRKFHVKTKVLTGDQKSVTLSVCRRLGVDTSQVMTGYELEQLSEDELVVTVERSDIFAELSPKQKASIVHILQENGHTVGFLGDGMNDLPAMTEADVGISVDTAVEAAKDTADVILLKKDLNVLEEGILEGRKAFANMSKYIKITASSNFGNIFSIVIASAILPFLPMAAIQLLLLNLLYDLLCITLPWDHVDSDVYSLPQKWSGENLGKFMWFFGPISSIFDIITYLFLYFILCPSICGATFTQLTDATAQAAYIAIFQTGWFLESMWTQVLIIQMLRTQKVPFFQSKPSAIVLTITTLGILLFTGLIFTPMAGWLGLTKLPFSYFGFLLIVVSCYMALTTLAKKYYICKYHELI